MVNQLKRRIGWLEGLIDLMAKLHPKKAENVRSHIVPEMLRTIADTERLVKKRASLGGLAANPKKNQKTVPKVTLLWQPTDWRNKREKRKE